VWLDLLAQTEVNVRSQASISRDMRKATVVQATTFWRQSTLPSYPGKYAQKHASVRWDAQVYLGVLQPPIVSGSAR
jgi:hypothetical protein